MRVLLAAILAIALSLTAYAAPISHDVTTKPKPWTRELAERDAGDFHFAIITDRTGGHRPGIFPSAMPKINSMNPEFVMCVGDLIEGYSDDEAELDRQWDEIRDAVNQLEAPFFYVPGNHDVLTPASRKVWTRRFGPTYYAFTYKGALFLCLDTIEGPTHKEGVEGEWPGYGIGDEQIAWVKKTLKEHADVRWTFVFMHVPLWVEDESAPGEERPGTGFKAVMESLADRPHTVFAGHYHVYTRYVQGGHEYYILATTGGVSSLAGPAQGEFDHITWVTVGKGSPDVAPILLSGILPKDAHSEKHIKFAQGMAVSAVRQASPNDNQFNFRFSMKNIWDEELHYTITWDMTESPGWKVAPATSEGTLEPDEETTIEFAAIRGKQRFPLPTVTCDIKAGPVTGEFDLPIMDAYLEASRPVTQAR